MSRDDSEGWAEDAFYRLQEKEGVGHEANQMQALKRQQVMANAPILWSRVVTKIRERIEAFEDKRPDYLTIEDHSTGYNDQFVKLHSPNCDVEVTFNPQAPQITYRAEKSESRPSLIGKGSFSFSVMDDDVRMLDDQHMPHSEGGVARIVLDYLI